MRKITPQNIVQAWGIITTNGAGGHTLQAGEGISATAINGTFLECTIDPELGAPSTGYWSVVATSGNSGKFVSTSAVTPTSFGLITYTSTTGAVYSAATNVLLVSFIVMFTR